MGRKLLLYISSQHATLGLWRANKLLMCQDIPANQDGWTDFGNILNSYKSTPVYIVTDAVDEDYRLESLPHVRGRDRKEMVERKLRQVYRNTAYCAALHQGRKTGKRTDDQYLFVAMTNADLVRPWLEILASRRAPLAGLYLLPSALAFLLRRLKLHPPNQLVLLKGTAGLRQAFFQRDQLRLSRLTPIDGSAEERNYLDEIDKTRFYLNSLRILDQDDPLAVTLLDPQNQLTGLAAALRNDPIGECVHLDGAALSTALGLSPSMLAASPNSLALLSLGMHTPEANLLPAALTRDYQRHRLALGIYATSAALALGALGVGLGLLLAQQGIENRIQDAATQRTSLEQQYRTIAAQFPATPIPAIQLEKAVQIAQRVQTASHLPHRALQVLSLVLTRHPSIIVNDIHWQSLTTQPDAANVTESTQTAAPLDGAEELTVIEGEVQPFGGDFRDAILRVEAFADTLRRQPGVKDVTIVSSPLNVSPGSNLAGSTSEGLSNSLRAPFTLRLTMETRQ